jgi:hypothetical protein
MNGGNAREAALLRSQDRFRRAVSGFDAAVLETAPAVGVWSVRDLVAHLVARGEEILLAAAHVLGGPPVAHHPITDFEAFNAACAARHRADSWPALQVRFDDLFAGAIAFAGQLSPEQLALPAAYPWGEAGTLDGLLRGIDEHQEEHNEQLEAWRHQLRPITGDGVASGIIPPSG